MESRIPQCLPTYKKVEDIFYKKGIIRKHLRIHLIGRWGGGGVNLWDKEKLFKGLK